MNALAQTQLDRALTFLEKREYAEAEVLFKRVLEDDPDNQTAQICLGRTFSLGAKYQEAEEYFNTLLKKTPGNVEVRLNRRKSNYGPKTLPERWKCLVIFWKIKRH